jgi:hypothetical protein
VRIIVKGPNVFSIRNLSLVCICAAFIACVLNPHPLPPEGADDRAGGFAPGADAGNQVTAEPTGPDGGGIADAAAPSDASRDAGLDGAGDSGDARFDATDAGPDAASDATAHDAGADGDAP